VIETVDRPHPDHGVGRIVILRVGPLNITFGGDEAQREATLAQLLDAAQTLYAASRARLDATLVEVA
jgi:hypothetical protein